MVKGLQFLFALTLSVVLVSAFSLSSVLGVVYYDENTNGLPDSPFFWSRPTWVPPIVFGDGDFNPFTPYYDPEDYGLDPKLCDWTEDIGNIACVNNLETPGVAECVCTKVPNTSGSWDCHWQLAGHCPTFAPCIEISQTEVNCNLVELPLECQLIIMEEDPFCLDHLWDEACAGVIAQWCNGMDP